jgi:hypothetical protein
MEDATKSPTEPNSLLRDFLNKSEICRELGICPRTLNRWHARRIGPPRIIISRKILYSRKSVLDWLRSRETGGRESGRSRDGKRSRAAA